MAIIIDESGNFVNTNNGLVTDTLQTAAEAPDAWNSIFIAGELCPGICLPIEGERKRDVDHKKSKGSTRDLLLDQGLEPTECTIKIKTTDGVTYRRLYEFYLLYMDPNRPLSRLTIVAVSHPQLYARGIKMGYFFAAVIPKPTADTGDRPYIHEFRFKIVGPKTQISAGSGSSKPKQAPGYAKPTVSPYLPRGGATTAVGVLIDKAKLLPGINAFVGINESLVQGPPVEAAVPRNAKELKAQADAGDPTAKFIVSIFSAGAP